MRTFLLKRVFQVFPLLIGISALTFLLLQLAPGDNKTLTARVTQTLPPGRYTVRWQAAGADGHPVRGEYLFEVAESAPVPEIRSTRFSSRDLGALFR